MRLHLFEHDPIDLARTNITIWAEKKGYKVGQTYVCNMEPLPSLEDFDWLMIMGGSPHAYEEEKNPWLPPEKAFIVEALEKHKIILGVCFGAQLLAEALGGEVFPNDNEEIGWHEIHLTGAGEESFLFRDLPKRFTSFHWHSDHFSLPPGCARLAFSEPTANQAYICEGRPIAGMQFHPEYTLDVVRSFSNDWGHEWETGPYSPGKEAVLKRTDKTPETYWLMEILLENMAGEFG